LTRPSGGPQKIFNSKRGPQLKKFGNRWLRESRPFQLMQKH